MDRDSGVAGPGAGGRRRPDPDPPIGAVDFWPARTRRPPIVDEQPLTTARAMAALASDWEEQRYSRQALKLADHSVDIAFSYEMRQATEHPAPPTPESKKLFARANQAAGGG